MKKSFKKRLKHRAVLIALLPFSLMSNIFGWTPKQPTNWLLKQLEDDSAARD